MNYLNIIKNKWQTVALVVLGVVVLSLVLSLIQPFEYRSQVELLIIQRQNVNLDAYAATRAAEKMATNLAQVIKTKSFFDKVINGNFGIKINAFPADEKDLRKVWQKKVETKVFPETSILSVEVFDKDKNQANRIAQGIAYILVNNSEEYHGGGQDVSIKVVNEPLVSNHPAKPKLILNVLIGLILGLVLSVGWIFYKINSEMEKENFNLDFDSQKYRKDKIKTMYDELDDLPNQEEL